jgi:hypothetical protein
MVEPHRHSDELIMKSELIICSSTVVPTAASLTVSAVSLVLGSFIAVYPDRAAKIWGAQRLNNLTPDSKALFVRWYRAFGILLCLVGVLLAADSIMISIYHQ